MGERECGVQGQLTVEKPGFDHLDIVAMEQMVYEGCPNSSSITESASVAPSVRVEIYQPITLSAETNFRNNRRY